MWFYIACGLQTSPYSLMLYLYSWSSAKSIIKNFLGKIKSWKKNSNLKKICFSDNEGQKFIKLWT